MVHKIIWFFSQYTDILERIIGVRSSNYIYFWKSRGLSDERLNSNTASNYTITPELSLYGTKTRV